MHTAACPTRIRVVFAATVERKISGALMWEYSTSAWCSTAHTRVEADLLRVDRLVDAVEDLLTLDIRGAVFDLGLEDHRELHACPFTD